MPTTTCMRLLLLSLSIFLLKLVTPLWAEDATGDASRQITPFFSPPKPFANDLGDYRSPLLFTAGQPVRSASDWKKRRAELLKQWQDLLGHWPPLITNPKVEVLESKRRENFQQLRIRFKWTPNEFTTGYLLIPDGDAPRPAVVTVYYEPETAIGLKVPKRDFAYQLAPRHNACGRIEVAQVKILLEHVQGVVNRHLEVRLEALTPEPAFYRDVAAIHFP